MKTSALFSFACAALLLAGCSSPKPLVLAPVGPPATARPTTTQSTGSLKVYTAYDQSPYMDALGRPRFTSYRILAQDDSLLQTVANNATPSGPMEIALTPGEYKIVAHANGYGVVTVPVVVGLNEMTVVHLDGASRWADGLPTNPVRLPHGEIAGWSVAQTHQGSR